MQRRTDTTALTVARARKELLAPTYRTRRSAPTSSSCGFGLRAFAHAPNRVSSLSCFEIVASQSFGGGFVVIQLRRDQRSSREVAGAAGS